MEAQSNEYGPVATRVLFENDDVKVWEMDLKPGDVCGLHHHTLDYVLFILASAVVGVESPGRCSYNLPARARSAYYIPAGGIESAHNVGATRFFEALFELKRPQRAGRPQPGYVGCEALAERDPEPGVAAIIDNDRVRVIETTLAPGGNSAIRRIGHDTAVYVAEGGRVKFIEKTDDGAERAREETLTSGQVFWRPKGTQQGIVNLGTGLFRQIAVEIK
ncbi:MAG: hypothetical protein ACREQF_05760 [Candidatus Binataceae bacterium]